MEAIAVEAFNAFAENFGATMLLLGGIAMCGFTALECRRRDAKQETDPTTGITSLLNDTGAVEGTVRNAPGLTTVEEGPFSGKEVIKGSYSVVDQQGKHETIRFTRSFENPVIIDAPGGSVLVHPDQINNRVSTKKYPADEIDADRVQEFIDAVDADINLNHEFREWYAEEGQKVLAYGEFANPTNPDLPDVYRDAIADCDERVDAVLLVDDDVDGFVTTDTDWNRQLMKLSAAGTGVLTFLLLLLYATEFGLV